METPSIQDLGNIAIVAQDLITRFSLGVLAAIAIIAIGNWLAKLGRQFVRRLASKANLDPTLTNFINALIYYGVLGFAVIAALNRLGVQTASLIALLGAAGLAVGLALQGSLANFAAGVLLLIFRRFQVGDLIEGADVFGHVEEISLFTTAVVTVDNKTVVIPNAKLTSENITNYSSKGKIRADMVVGVAYETDIDHVRRVTLETMAADDRILRSPAPSVVLTELADSSLNFSVRPWVKPEDYIPVKNSLYEVLKKRFDQEGITIPFPQRDVHLFQAN
ncbi:mechanosensitive ion channel family protein [Leptolyngbya sp. PCC 6406]|uniref:mechanosensitive ion channel family protein n=1 Tax=Leptolyngbya sp. PCC 6406 TaxID=1173264 RepID=UPI0002AD0161|nr:mechanosensitive ion channel domain-containing protein [Leptolyngbya sp. PCC 6406]